MNTTKHTAGPWTSGQVGNGQVFDIIGADITGRGGEIVGSFRASQNRDANEANAQLIAAAPELLAALEIINALAKNGIITRHETGKPTWCLVNELSKITNAALARATGKAEQLAEYDTAKKEALAWREKAERDEHPGRGFCTTLAEQWEARAVRALASL